MKVFDWIVEHWYLIPIVLESLCTVSVCILGIKKKPVKVVDTLKEIICRVLPALINLCELQVGLSSNDKKSFVLTELKKVLHEQGYGDDVVAQYLPFASEQVEVILSTPQKKGIKK